EAPRAPRVDGQMVELLVPPPALVLVGGVPAQGKGPRLQHLVGRHHPHLLVKVVVCGHVVSFRWVGGWAAPAGCRRARQSGRAYQSERRADGARKKRCAIPLTRSKELFQPDARSDLLLLGPGLRPGRCGWVGSPEGVGRGSRNTLPPPLAQRSANSNKKAPVSGRSVRLYIFCKKECQYNSRSFLPRLARRARTSAGAVTVTVPPKPQTHPRKGSLTQTGVVKWKQPSGSSNRISSRPKRSSMASRRSAVQRRVTRYSGPPY